MTHPESIEEVERIAGPGSVQWARPPTSPAFLGARSGPAAREVLGLPSEGKVVVVSGGGWGVGKLETAIRASLAVEDTTVVCLCGHNDELMQRLESTFSSESRVRLLGFTDQMGEVLAAANALVHSTAGLTVLEAIIRGCPVISFGFSAGHVGVNNKALERFGLAHVARSEAELVSTLRAALKQHPEADLRFAERPSAASLLLKSRPRIRPLPLWRLRLGRSVAAAAATILTVTMVFASDDSYTLIARALDLPPMTNVTTEKKQVALVVDAPAPVVPVVARGLAARHLHASFALNRSASPQTITTLRQLGDEPIPKLAPGGPVRWLGTVGQLKHTARALGIAGHFFYAVPGTGFTFGQYVLGHVDGATPVAAAANYGAGQQPPKGLDKGDIVKLVAAGGGHEWRQAVRSLTGELNDSGLAAVPVTALVAGG